MQAFLSENCRSEMVRSAGSSRSANQRREVRFQFGNLEKKSKVKFPFLS